MALPRYTLITGDFYIRYPDLPRNGPEPDGDTINFLPDDDDVVRNLPRFNEVGPDRKHLGTYGVRFEGIDTLETHFQNQHQDLKFAVAARDRMLELMGFGDITFFADRPNKVQTVENHPIPGYLLANGIESNGRVLALVFPGVPDLRGAGNGERVFVDEALLESAVNAQLVRDGLAYAELYSTMPLDLIVAMRALIAAARAAGAGMWPTEDLTLERRVQISGTSQLSELIMFPKLYRRLVSYFATGASGLAGFDPWVRADPLRDDRVLLPSGELGNLHDLYDVDADGLVLTELPEALMFDPIPSGRRTAR